MDNYFQNNFPKYLVVRRTTRSQCLVVLTHFLVVEDTRTREFCYPVYGIKESFCWFGIFVEFYLAFDYE